MPWRGPRLLFQSDIFTDQQHIQHFPLLKKRIQHFHRTYEPTSSSILPLLLFSPFFLRIKRKRKGFATIKARHACDLISDYNISVGQEST